MRRSEHLLAKERHNGCRLTVDEPTSCGASATVMYDSTDSLEKPFWTKLAEDFDESCDPRDKKLP